MQKTCRRTLALTAIAIGIGAFEAQPSGQLPNLIISEFRLRGPAGANDEFVEIYNPRAVSFTVSSGAGSTGFAVAASDGVTRFVIPNGTVIPARGHYLGVNITGYSLATYPADATSTATGDVTYTTNIPDNMGIALFNTSIDANFALANRLDAVGSTTEANTLYKEGSGLSGDLDAITRIQLPPHRDERLSKGHERQRCRLPVCRYGRDVGRRGSAARRAGAGGPDRASANG